MAEGEATVTGELDWLTRLGKGRQKGLVRRGAMWWHVSTRDSTVKVRKIVDDELDEVGKAYDIAEPVEKAELLALLDGSELFAGWATKELAPRN